eukprot:Sdes_comp20546_c0_seq2m15261
MIFIPKRAFRHPLQTTHIASSIFPSSVHQSRNARKSHDASFCTISQPKTKSYAPADSFINILYPFKHSKSLTKDYVYHKGQMRLGKLFESMDALAAACCCKHLNLSLLFNSNLSIVTASVDNIRVVSSLDQMEDVLMQGYVIWTGASSAKVRLELFKSLDDISFTASGLSTRRVYLPFMTAAFTIVAIDSTDGKPSCMIPVVPSSAQEKKWFQEEQKKYLERKAEKLNKNKVNASQQLECFNLWFPQSEKKKIAMSETLAESNHFMFPAARNTHGKVFGGYLMRKSFELAKISVIKNCASADPEFLFSSDINFIKPVDIGSILNFKSCVSLTKEDFVMVSVTANVFCHKTKTFSTTNTFHYCFQAKIDFHVFSSTEQEMRVQSQAYKAFHFYQKQCESFIENSGDQKKNSLDLDFYANPVITTPPYIVESPYPRKIMEPFPLDILDESL